MTTTVMTLAQVFERACVFYVWCDGAAAVARNWDELEAAAKTAMATQPQFGWITQVDHDHVIQILRLHFDRWSIKTT